MKYDLTTLYIFLCVAEENSLTKGSTRAHLAVSAISKRIGEFESRLGYSLFTRSSRGVDLTHEGKVMLQHTKRIFHNIQEMDNAISDFSSVISGKVRIHSTTSALSQFLPKHIEEISEKYPGISLEIEGRVGTAVIDGIVDRSADIGVFASQNKVNGVESFKYKTYELAVAVPNSDPLSLVESLKFSDLVGHELISQHSDSLLYKKIFDEAYNIGVELKVGMRVSSYDCICQLVAIKQGIAILPRTIIDIYSNVIPIKSVTLDESWAERELRVGVKSYEVLPKHIRVVVDHLAGFQTSQN